MVQRDADLTGNAVEGRSLREIFAAASLALPAASGAGGAVFGMTDDSRCVEPGWVFVAVRGEAVDGHRFIRQAFERGAGVVVAERLPEGVSGERVILFPDTRAALGRLAQAWYGNPTRDMLTVGVTGTNGKTTVAFLLEALLAGAGRHPAMLGTIEYRFYDWKEPAPNTTPGAMHLARFLSGARARGADAMAMEVSSHALSQKRVEGLHFDAAILTNVTQDHLDYHGTMDAYARAKRLLFTHHAPAHAVFNHDDLTSRNFAHEHAGDAWTFSLDAGSGADVYAAHLETDARGVRMEVVFPIRAGGERIPIESRLLGRFNASNLLAVAACGAALGIDPLVVCSALGAAAGPPGRVEAVDEGQPFGVYVDYAHTPDAVERVLENVRALTSGRLIAVLGCGGDRDPDKRPKMGRAMGRLADYSIVTNDNPRTESPERIAEAVEHGLRESAAAGAYEVCLDRREAIRRAIARAVSGDCVVIAGKGHEDYQIVGTEKHHFDDREVAREVLRERIAGGKDW